MNKATTQQIKKISTLITQQGLTTDIKESLVFQFTNGRATSRSDMSVSEAADLIQFLVKDDPSTKMRNKVFAIAHALGWLYKGLHELNRMIIDRFLEIRGVVKKPLAKMDRAELAKVVTQFELIQQKFELKSFNDTAISQILEELGIDRETGKRRGS